MTKYVTFPWEQLGQMLRSLSLSGSTGNITAWMIFLLIGALPLTAALLLWRRHRAHKADLLLLSLSAALYAGLWFFINPSYMDRYLSPVPMNGAAKYALAAAIDSLLLTWLLLRYLLYCKKMPHNRLLSTLRILLDIYVALSAATVLVQGGAQFIEECNALEQSNTGADSSLVTISVLFLALRAILALLPTAAKLTLLLLASDFLRNYGAEAYSERTYARMERLTLASSRFLILILLSNVSFNMLQLLFSRFLLSSFHRVLFPLTDLLLVLGIRLFGSLYLEGKRLKEDNDMFI